MLVDFDAALWRAERLDEVELALSQWIGQGTPEVLAEPMRYAVLGGGKRMRALLAMAAQEAVQGQREAGLRAACALELIHAYSLIHDDMPCMDNDVLRRGKPTVHVQFGEASALLAGDALQSLAFELLTPDGDVIPPAQQARLCGLLARAAGGSGMAGGQAIDLASVGVALDEPRLREMHSLKTGALLQASVLMGAACAVPSSVGESTWEALTTYADALGLAFQVVDDVLDVTADAATLGKTAGKDAANDKPTYVSLLGLDKAQNLAHSLLEQALTALAESGLQDTRALAALARLVVQRTS
jgi:farnesyl diphosphate synthase